MTEDTADRVASWFDEYDLDECPSCGARTLTNPEHRVAVRICINCDHVEFHERDA